MASIMRPLQGVLWTLIILCACDGQPRKDLSASNSDTSSAQCGCCAPPVVDTAWYSSGRKAPLFSGLGGLHFSVSTASLEAQTYFNQGLMLSFGFNHAEAARSFFEAARQDSECAMCYWGYAYVLGPNYNAGMEKENYQRAYDAVQKARSLSSQCTPKERDLIAALSQRYSNDSTITRHALDSAYAEAMRSVHRKYPSDATVGALFAESLMDLHPWNLYAKDGSIQTWTPEILSVLEHCLQLEPMHAGANHFYIHATEMSQHAESALASANRLRDLVPGSGHLVHMPSHTYIRIGMYHDGVVANQNAVRVDSLYTEACHAQGVYPLAYYPHNHHFISACATLCGESKIALASANAASRLSHKKLMQDPAWATLQHYYSIPWFVEVKLGLWNEILRSPAPEKVLKYPSVVWHYAQGMAMLSRNRVADARSHLAAMHEVMMDTAMKELSIWGINSVYDICVIAAKTLEGEICAKEKNYSAALAFLKDAVAKEDALNYDEPPDWFFSVRHHLGAVLIEAGRSEDAIRIYLEDLTRYRENGWALMGLMNAYQQRGETSKYKHTRKRFDDAWKHADLTIASSRIL